MFYKKSVLKNFANFTGKHLCWSLFLINLQDLDLQLYWKETLTQVFSSEISEIFKYTYFKEHLRVNVFTNIKMERINCFNNIFHWIFCTHSSDNNCLNLKVLLLRKIFCLKLSLPSQHLLVQGQQWKYQNNVWSMFKVNNKDKRTTSLTSF